MTRVPVREIFVILSPIFLTCFQRTGDMPMETAFAPQDQKIVSGTRN